MAGVATWRVSPIYFESFSIVLQTATSLSVVLLHLSLGEYKSKQNPLFLVLFSHGNDMPGSVRPC